MPLSYMNVLDQTNYNLKLQGEKEQPQQMNQVEYPISEV